MQKLEVLCIVAALLCGTTIGRASAQYVELIPFETVTVTTQQILTGGRRSSPENCAFQNQDPKSWPLSW